MNIVTVSTFRRPFHTRLCLEAICRAHRWHPWAAKIIVFFAQNWHEHPMVRVEAEGVAANNKDIPFEFVFESCDSNPHVVSKYMLDHGFGLGADMVLYVEDDAVLSPDAFVMLEGSRRFTLNTVCGVCLYHETILEQYQAEGRLPDPALLHYSNGLNTCGGTAFLREPYLKYLRPEWNGKTVEPKGFDYSAHFSMYKHGLFVIWPDYSRSYNIGYELGSISGADWAKYFGRSLKIETANALRDPFQFRMELENIERETKLVLEDWMVPELSGTGEKTYI
jgi:hypothetical protein